MDSDTNNPPRQNILASLLRTGRPRSAIATTNTSTHQQDIASSPPSAPLQQQNHHQQQPNPPFPPPPATTTTPNQGPAGHRRRPAASLLQPGQQPPPSRIDPRTLVLASHTHMNNVSFTQMLRRRRSANGPALTTPSAANVGAHSLPPQPVSASVPNAPLPIPSGPPHRIRLVPHLENARSLVFDPITRECKDNSPAIRIGRFTERSGSSNNSNTLTGKIAFKSKVVSRGHAEIWCESNGKFFIKDTSSSSGTFLNHMRLSHANVESRPFQLKDGDILQLGVDYQGGTEEIYRCVKIRIEIGREWQAQPNAFNTSALAQLKQLSNLNGAAPAVAAPKSKSGGSKIAKASVSDCCICLFPVTVCQALFIAPCSHSFHYKCIRTSLNEVHPGFLCPLCRSFHNLEADVEIELPEETEEWEEVPEASAADGPKRNESPVQNNGALSENDGDVIIANGRSGIRHADDDDLPFQTAAEDNGTRLNLPGRRDVAPPTSYRTSLSARRATMVANDGSQTAAAASSMSMPALPLSETDRGVDSEGGLHGAGADTDMDLDLDEPIGVPHRAGAGGSGSGVQRRSTQRNTMYNLTAGGSAPGGMSGSGSGSSANLPIAGGSGGATDMEIPQSGPLHGQTAQSHDFGVLVVDDTMSGEERSAEGAAMVGTKRKR